MHLNKISSSSILQQTTNIPSKRGWIKYLITFWRSLISSCVQLRSWFLIWEPQLLSSQSSSDKLTRGRWSPLMIEIGRDNFYPGMIFSLSWREQKHGEGYQKKNRWIESFEKFWVFGLMSGANSALNSIKDFAYPWFVHNFLGLSQTLLKGEGSNLWKCPDFISK